MTPLFPLKRTKLRRIQQVALRALWRPISLPMLLAVLLLPLAEATADAGKPTGEHGDFITERAYLADEQDTLDFDAVQKAAFTPYEQTFSRYRAIPYWIRLRLDVDARAHSTGANSLHLHIQQRNALTVEVFQRGNGAHCPRTADRVWPTPEDKRSPTGWFKLPLCPDTTTVYLKLRSSAEPTLRVMAVPLATAERRELIESGAMWLVVGAIFLAVMLATAHGLTHQSPASWGFLLQQITLTLYLLAQWQDPPLEVLRAAQLWLAEFPLQVWRSGMLAGHLLFMYTLVTSRYGRTRSAWLLVSMSVGCAVAAAASAVGHGAWTASVSGSFFLLGLPLALGAVWPADPTVPEPERTRTRLWSGRITRLGTVVLTWLTCLSVYIWFDPPVLAGYLLASLLLLGIATQVDMARQSRREVALATAERLGREHAEREARREQERRSETRDLLMMLTHEIRTPLSVLRLATDETLTGTENIPAVRKMKEEAIADMDGLIERCLQTADLDDATQAETIATWDSHAELQLLSSYWARTAPVSLELPQDLPVAQVRPAVTRMILNVLVDNARKYGAERGAITIAGEPASRQGKDGVLLSVTNAVGPAGQPDPLRLFSKYYRASTAHSHVGAGLGLHLASRLAEGMGAELAYQPLNHFTRFTLWLPC